MSNNNAETNSTADPRPSFFTLMMHKIMSGGVAGAMEVLVNHPFWTLKTRFQNKAIPKNQKMTFKPSVLYAGLRANVLSMAPITAIQVGGTEGLKNAMISNSEEGDISPAGNLAASSLAGGFSGLVSGPTELIMAKQTPERGFMATASDLVKNQGYRVLKTGMGGTAIREAVFTSGYMTGASSMSKYFTPYMSKERADLAGGVTAGVGAAIVSQPFDAIKTAQQTSGSTMPMWRMMLDTLKNEGFSALYKGSIPRKLRVIVAIPLIDKVKTDTNEALERKSSWFGPKN